jgi:hypothetical protein
MPELCPYFWIPDLIPARITVHTGSIECAFKNQMSLDDILLHSFTANDPSLIDMSDENSPNLKKQISSTRRGSRPTDPRIEPNESRNETLIKYKIELIT